MDQEAQANNDTYCNQSSRTEFLIKDEGALCNPEPFSKERSRDKLKKREALIKEYVNVRKLALVASGLGENGFSSF